MAKIKGFSILSKTDYAGLRKYLDFWAGVVDMKVTPFMEAHDWFAHVTEVKIANKIVPPGFRDLPKLPLIDSELEEQLQGRGFLVHWEFDVQNLRTVLEHWTIYKSIAGTNGYPINGDGVE